jgi:hypothetical protein
MLVAFARAGIKLLCPTEFGLILSGGGFESWFLIA